MWHLLSSLLDKSQLSNDCLWRFRMFILVLTRSSLCWYSWRWNRLDVVVGCCILFRSVSIARAASANQFPQSLEHRLPRLFFLVRSGFENFNAGLRAKSLKVRWLIEHLSSGKRIQSFNDANLYHWIERYWRRGWGWGRGRGRGWMRSFPIRPFRWCRYTAGLFQAGGTKDAHGVWVCLAHLAWYGGVLVVYLYFVLGSVASSSFEDLMDRRSKWIK